MKKSNSIVIFAIASLFAAGLAFAGAATVAAKAAGCCTKAKDKGEKCPHSCCAEAAKTGDNCGKCKGVGKIADLKVEKKP